MQAESADCDLRPLRRSRIQQAWEPGERNAKRSAVAKIAPHLVAVEAHRFSENAHAKPLSAPRVPRARWRGCGSVRAPSIRNSHQAQRPARAKSLLRPRRRWHGHAAAHADGVRWAGAEDSIPNSLILREQTRFGRRSSGIRYTVPVSPKTSIWSRLGMALFGLGASLFGLGNLEGDAAFSVG